jgi:hypothetical protein
MNIPKPNLKAAKARADAAQAKLTEIEARYKAELDSARSELWAANDGIRRQEGLIKLAKIAADAPEVLAALKANRPVDCPNGVSRGLVYRTVCPTEHKWSTTGEIVRSLVAELSGVVNG